MFYARVKGVYVAIMMLVVTLLFETFLDQTAGSQWHIGIAALGGNNGLGRFSGDIHEPPSLTLGFGSRVIEFSGQSLSLYYLEVALLIVSYLGLRALVNSRFGLVLAAIREDFRAYRSIRLRHTRAPVDRLLHWRSVGRVVGYPLRVMG